MSKRAVWGVLAGLLMVELAGAAELSVDFTFSADDIELTAAGEYTSIEIKDGSRVMDEVGAPSIPAKFANVLIPSGARNVSIAASGEWTLLAEGITPYPAQPRSPKSKAKPAFVSANARYASAAAWPAEIATYQGDHDMQGYQFVSVRVNPLAYIAAEKKLYLRETVTVTVTYDAPVAAKKILPKQKTAFEPLVNSLVVNPEAAADFAPALETRVPRAALDYLIITSGGLSNAFQQIADYRASAVGGGYTTRVMTTNDIGSAYSGADIQAKIRDCISNNVATLGTTMVLLGGDDTIVPVRGCKVSAAGDTELTMPTDLYYSGLGGSWDGDSDGTYGETSDSVDLAYDVVVGRLPMRTATQVTNYLNKVMTYEAGWNVTNKIMLGGPYAWDTWTGTARPSDDVTGDGHAGFRSTDPAHDSVSDSEAWLRRLYRDGIHDYWPAQVNIMCDTITSWDTSDCGSYLQSSANTASKFNQNYTHLMFSGHGAPQEWGLESGYFDDADASSQTGLTAFVYTDACLTGHFDKNSNNIDGYNYTTEPCLGEAFLRNTRVRGGALAYMGCARYGWGEPGSYDGGPSTVYAYKFYKRMYETTNRTIGLAFAMHKADMASLSSKDDCERWIQFGVNLLGDPALKMPRDVPVPSAPSFTSASSFGATTGVEKTHSVVASGYPTPVLSLQSSSASAGSYSFVASSGVLTYQPPAADEGTKTFTFVATNTQGSVTQIVSATVTLAPPAAPASIWASATNTTDFTAAWSSVADATGYRLDVGTNSSFSTGGGAGGTNLIEEGFASASPSGWAMSGVGTYSSSPYVGTLLSGTYSIKFDGTGDYAVTPTMVPGATNLQFWSYGNGGSGSTFAISGLVDSAWTLVDTVEIAQNGATYNVALDPATTQIGFYFTKTYNCALDDVIVQASLGDPSFVPGYSNRTVAGTSQSVTGLTAGANYYFRARAVNAGGSSPNTSVASVTTLATLSAPVFGANPGPVAATAGVDAGFTVSASGVPAPTLALDSTTAEAGSYDFDAGTGDVLYIAPQGDAGQQTFSFSAVNSQGSAYQTVTVNVAAATAPAFTGGAGPYSTTAGVEVAFTVTASGTAPTLALQSQTASSGYSFTPATGAFTYTPPAGDVGTQTFTFTAANAAGTVTQVTSVSVAAVPTAPDAPASVWASVTNDTGFTAAWSASAGATSYRLDVGTNETFSAGGGSVNLMSNAGFESGDSTSWTKFETEYAVVSTDPQEGTYHVAITATSTRDLTQNVAITGDGTTEYEISYWYKGSGNARIWASWTTGGQVSGDNLQPGTYNPAASEWTKMTYTVVPQSGANILFYEIRTYNGASMNYDNFFVGAAGGGSTPSYVSGYSNRTVSGTSESVTGLVAEAGYYFRVRAVNDVGMSGDSSVASVTTLAESVPGTPPVVDAIPAQTANVGSLFDYTVTATATDGDPILAYGCSSAVDTNVWDFDVNTGYFVFEPTAVQLGTNLFDFTATDKDGASAAVQMSVKVYSAAASNEFTQWVEDQEEDPVDPDFAEGADIDGDGQTTYEEYLADTDPAASNSVLRLEGQSADLTEFTFPASPERFYQFVYTADLTSTQTNDIGWGVPGMVVTSTVPGTWFGTIRVLLDDPAE